MLGAGKLASGSVNEGAPVVGLVCTVASPLALKPPTIWMLAAVTEPSPLTSMAAGELESTSTRPGMLMFPDTVSAPFAVGSST